MLQVYLNLLDTQEDKEKFEQLYALYKDKMYKVAYQILHNRHDAEDAVHDSVIAIIDDLEKIKKINCHETWSYIVTIVKSRAFNIYQRKGKRSEREAREQDYRNYPCEQQESPEDAYLYKDVTTILQKLILELPYPKRQILYLHYYMDMTFVEIAKIVELSEEMCARSLPVPDKNWKNNCAKGESQMEMNRISDELLREAVKQACEREGTYYEEFTKDAKHHFSIRHQIRMRRLYRKMKRKKAEEPVDRYRVYTYPITETDNRRQFVSTRVPRLRPRLFLIVVLLMVGMSMTVFAIEPIREGIYQLIEKCFSDHTDISFEKVQSEIKGQEEEIKEFKPQKLEYVPEGYVLENEETDETFLMYSADYVNEEDYSLFYEQTAIQFFNPTISSNGERMEKIDVKNKQGYWIKDTGGWNHLIYVNDGYVYYLSGHENIDNLISILEKNKKIK